MQSLLGIVSPRDWVVIGGMICVALTWCLTFLFGNKNYFTVFLSLGIIIAGMYVGVEYILTML